MNGAEKPKAVFVLSTGRCGTMTMAHLLDLSPEIRCYHEPSPRLIVESKRAYEGSPCAGEVFTACRVDLITEALHQGLIYGECANRSTFFAPHIDRLFHRKVRFIHLLREPEGFKRSALLRDWYNGNPWDMGRISPREGWQGQTQGQKIEWLWHETNRFIEDFLQSVEPERKMRFDFSDLSKGDMEPMRGLFSFMGVEPPEEERLRGILSKKLNATRNPPKAAFEDRGGALGKESRGISEAPAVIPEKHRNFSVTEPQRITTPDRGGTEDSPKAAALHSANPTQQPLPACFSLQTLKKNLDALSVSAGELVNRICLPVEGNHIRFLPDGEVRYERHRTLLPFAIPQDQVASTLGSGSSTAVLLFGAGLGEQLDSVLASNGRKEITVWERDPWLLRLVLMRRDYSAFIRAGSLRFSLCSDLLELIPKGMEFQVIAHPFLQALYHNEYVLLQQGIGGKRAMVCSGGLFVDDISQALRGDGFSLYTLDHRGLSLQEIERTVRRFDPRFLFAVNYTPGLVELCHKLHVPLICWEVDPAADRLRPLGAPSESAHIFTYRRPHVEAFKAAGFRNVEYLPLASDPARRSPPALSAEDRERYGAPLSFVGSSMVAQAGSFRQIFLQQYKSFRREAPEATQEGNALLEQLLALQRRDFSVYRIPELLEQHFSDFIHHLSESGFSHDPFMLGAEIAAAEKRINYIANLGRLGIRVWGDEGWKVTERFGVKVMGRAGHSQELNKIYGASLINVDVNRLYQPDIVTMRIFDIMACGGFVLAEYSPALEELFSIGKEVEAYTTLGELLSKTRYYLEHRHRAAEIADAGREAVLARHTIRARMEHMLLGLSQQASGANP